MPPTVTVEMAHYEELKKLAHMTKAEIDQRVLMAIHADPHYRDDPAYRWKAQARLTPAAIGADKYKPAPMPSDAEIDAVLAQIKRRK